MRNALSGFIIGQHTGLTYGIKEANGLISFDEGFDTPVLMADFARFDEYRQAVESVQSNV
ncbi:hypothetical protein PUS82_02405 [Cytobacillus firmus]|uniref:hypothetical protein n=1 Tax=Cytobacillus firmus TaxID=1399 RepID=UPI00237B6C8D|nr:hypothetical protein [Cytobacillus firmus]MDD9310175.1 hypothetical protein [Cytobacillus firmus]MED1942925.1 hypothetical protein [Cytobacillus firmus]